MITLNTCPYCDAAYTIAAAGCVAQCRAMAIHQQLVREAIEAEERLGLLADELEREIYKGLEP
jgi:hypothetical protein